VYRIDSDKAVILTVDFITPVVDDPYDYGAVAAANSLSDVYAMGGKPAVALNVCGFPSSLPAEIAAEILRGGAETVLAAGAVVAGGHTVDDDEPKYGLCVMGIVHPSSIMTKASFTPGDALVLTKPLGTGMITTAAKGDMAEPGHLASALETMKGLNRDAAEVFGELGVRGCTDVTGFGILGHSVEAAEKSGATLEIDMNELEFLPGARGYAGQCLFPGGSRKNLDCCSCAVDFDPKIDEISRLLLSTPETSGGLLASVPENLLHECLEKLGSLGIPVRVIGGVKENQDTAVILRAVS
jgi:selenide,water dikinase